MPSYTRRRKRPSHSNSKIITGPLRSSYGYVVLPKGMNLYHVGIKTQCELPNKSVLFTTYHPSEWYIEDAFVSVIELQKDVRLLFMIDTIHNMRIYSALNNLTDIPGGNLLKMKSDNCKLWLPYLQREFLDGWFTSIENKTTVEFAIRNDPSILKLISCQPLQLQWNNSKFSSDGTLIPKNWGTVYPVYTKKPIHFIIPKRYEPLIVKYISQIQEQDTYGTAFSLLLKNAIITYTNEPFIKIHWDSICNV